jgi:rod shape-determining protein MreC
VKYIEQERSRLKLIINILFLMLALLSFLRTSKSFKEASAFESLLIEFLAPLQRGVTSVQSNFSSFFKHYLINLNASKYNDKLVKKVSLLESKIFQFRELESENNRLKNLLQFGKEVSHKTVLAQIVARDSNSDFKVLRINRGSTDGIRLQSTVVTSKGLVGYVFRLTDHFADVLTVQDFSNKVDGMIRRIRAHGILEGSGKGRVSMKYVTKTEPVILNDLVITSGLGNIYPKGIRIGRVTKIEREDYGLTQNIEISPTVNFNQLEEVLVIVAENNLRKKREWEVLDNPSKAGEGNLK